MTFLWWSSTLEETQDWIIISKALETPKFKTLQITQRKYSVLVHSFSHWNRAKFLDGILDQSVWNYFLVFCFYNRFAQPYSLKPLHKNHRQLTLDVYLKVYLLSLMRQQLLSMHYFYQFFTHVFLLAS